MNKLWSDDAWDDYLYWQEQDRKTLKRINKLLRDIDRNGYIENGQIKIAQCRTHYDD
jgi:Txe/YoeB family toxin of Txe-Axe toxin-antitoxin module